MGKTILQPKGGSLHYCSVIIPNRSLGLKPWFFESNMSKSCQYRWFLVKSRIAKKLSDHLVFRCNALTNRQLTVWRLSANCLDGFCWRKELSDVRNSDDGNWMRWQNPENRNMGVTTLTYWADVWQQICPTGASTLPMMGKHVAPLGQAACPILTQIGR